MLSYIGAVLVSLMYLGEVELDNPFIIENWVEEIEMNCFNIMTLAERYGNQIDQYVRLDPNVIGYDELRYLTILHYGYDGYIYQGELIVNKSVAEEVLAIFQELYAISYPIEKMQVMSCYDGDDEASMMANNSSAFNFRYVTNGGKLSKHAYGLAIDLNPLVNPYVKADVVLPSTGVPYLNRNQCVLGMIKKNDAVYEIFTRYGWNWGGDWISLKDYQHFEKTN